MAQLVIETFVLGEFQTNCFVVHPAGSTSCWIVDCGFSPEPMIEHVIREGLTPEAIVLTHAHVDHIAGLDIVRQRFPDAPVYLHEAERGFCSDPLLNLGAMMAMDLRVSEPTTFLAGGETLELAGTSWRVLHAPGHSPGSTVFVNDEAGLALAGDTLFAGSIGRIDFPTSDPAAMQRSIMDTMLALPDATAIHPGHGPATTIGEERRSNPFIREWASR